MKHNYHTHTTRCNHAEGEDREYIENAIKGGMETLGFSDHAPYLFPNTDYYSAFRMQIEELEELISNFVYIHYFYNFYKKRRLK
jgi:histidinol-phosphatase (PHP family)